MANGCSTTLEHVTTCQKEFPEKSIRKQPMAALPRLCFMMWSNISHTCIGRCCQLIRQVDNAISSQVFWQDRQFFILVIKVTNWGCQMSSDLVIEYIWVITSLSKGCHQVVTSCPLGHQGYFEVVTWVITKSSPMVLKAIIRPSSHCPLSHLLPLESTEYSAGCNHGMRKTGIISY